MNVFVLMLAQLFSGSAYYWVYSDAEKSEIIRIDNGKTDTLVLRAFSYVAPVVYGCGKGGVYAEKILGDSLGEYRKRKTIVFGREGISSFTTPKHKIGRFVVWDSLIAFFDYEQVKGESDPDGHGPWANCRGKTLRALDVTNANIVNWTCPDSFMFPLYSSSKFASNADMVFHPKKAFRSFAEAIYKRLDTANLRNAKIVYQDDTVAYVFRGVDLLRCTVKDTVCSKFIEVEKRYSKDGRWKFYPPEYCPDEIGDAGMTNASQGKASSKIIMEAK